MYIQLNLDDIHYNRHDQLSFSYCCYCHRCCRCCLTWFDWKSFGEIYSCRWCWSRRPFAVPFETIQKVSNTEQTKGDANTFGTVYQWMSFIRSFGGLCGISSVASRRSCRPSWKGIALLCKALLPCCIADLFHFENEYGSGLRCVRPSAVSRLPHSRFLYFADQNCRVDWQTDHTQARSARFFWRKPPRPSCCIIKATVL